MNEWTFIPHTYDTGYLCLVEDDAARFSRNFEGGWQLGLLVARDVCKRARPGKPSESEQVRNKVSCSKFAELARVSERTVQLVYDIWQLAAEEGHCTPAEQLLPGDDDPKLSAVDVRSQEHREMWRNFYREVRQSKRSNGGARGSRNAADTLTRAKTAIHNINGLDGVGVEKQSEICRLIDELLASIQPATESNLERTELTV
ncbi:hypothetical protein ACAG24_025165 [Mycobacterium sp. pW049]|uniref:hypothetical protein n=1 Tax=[Mycobacterium] bulgaricum TaxID=3238985 RepID=UPI00351B15FD